MEIESKNFTPQFDEEHEEHFTMQRVSSIVWIKRLAVISFLLSLAQIVLNIIHFLTYHMHLVIILLISGFAFLIGTILIFHWARQAQRAYVQSRELFQPRVNDRLTRSIFVMGLLFAAETVILLVNILMQRDYSNDYIRAQDTNDAIWDSKYQGRTPESLTGFYNLSFLLQACFMGFFFIYFILTGRTAFKCLKWDNQGMTHFVFVASVILLGAGLGLIYYCRFAAGFDSYPHIRENLPKWNVTLLLVLGIFAAVVAIIGFVVDHRGWRVGFLLLGALCLVLIVSLSAFTGLAYKGADKTYDYYEGVNNTNTCSDRLYHVHKVHIEKYGCPQKYVPTDQCDQTQWVTRWEPIQATEVEEESDETDSGEAEKKEAGAAPERSSDTEDTEESEEEETQTSTTPPPAETEGETQTESTTPETEDEGQTSTTEGQTAPETETEASTSQNNANTGNQDVNESSGNTQTSTVSDGSTTQTTTTTTGDDGTQTTTTTIVTSTSTNETTGLLMFAQQNYYDPNYYCLNTKCCGLLGQMYSRHMLNMANMGLLTILISCLITMACYYFWYVKYVDSARDKKKDFVWVGLMVLVVVAFVLATIFTKRPYFAEKLDANGQRTFVF